MKKLKTPNALPPTMISLGEKFGNASLTLAGARQVRSITTLSIGSRAANKREGTNVYPYHLIDLWGNDGTGKNTILVRSRQMKITTKKLRDLHRKITRKLAVFLFENQDRY